VSLQRAEDDAAHQQNAGSPALRLTDIRANRHREPEQQKFE
jgi:hypothetical protein